jgi:hypothetical protein
MGQIHHVASVICISLASMLHYFPSDWEAAKKIKDYNIKNSTTISITLDMSENDRQLHKKIVEQRKSLNSQLKNDELYYYGIRNYSVVKINKKNLS